MRAFKDYESTAEFTPNEKLPAGAYVVRIIRAEDRDNALCILFDIAEGEYKDYFKRKLQSDQRNYPDTAKFKGVYRLWYEREGDPYAESSKSRRKTVLKLIKDENKLNVDYTKEWDGNALKGAKAAMIFRDQEYDYNGRRGFSAQPYGLVPMEDFRNGKFTIPEPKRLKADRRSSASDDFTSGFSDVSDDEDLPF